MLACPRRCDSHVLRGRLCGFSLLFHTLFNRRCARQYDFCRIWVFALLPVNIPFSSTTFCSMYTLNCARAVCAFGFLIKQARLVISTVAYMPPASNNVSTKLTSKYGWIVSGVGTSGMFSFADCMLDSTANRTAAIPMYTSMYAASAPAVDLARFSRPFRDFALWAFQLRQATEIPTTNPTAAGNAMLSHLLVT